MIIPTSVVQYNDYSDIEEKVVDYQMLMLDIDKEWLFKKNKNASNVFMHNMSFVQKHN